MKIGIDISSVVYETGVSYYTLNLIKSLLALPGHHQYILFGGSLRRLGDLTLKTNELKGNFKTRFYPIPPVLANFIWNRLHILPIEIFTGSLDIFHSSDWSQPPSRVFKVTTVHDLSPIIFPEMASADWLRNVAKVHKSRFYWIQKEVDRIIVPSNATKQDLIKQGFDGSRIRVIHEALDPVFEEKIGNKKIVTVRKKYGITKKYLLGNGVSKRKNTQRIIKAFSKLKGEFQLVLIGEPKMNISKVDGVIFTGHIPSQDRPALYSGAEAFLYPSIYEGFGLPILEAFACNCPVITSNISSMPEVAGLAAVLVDPFNVDSISEGIHRAISNRTEYIKKGQIRLKDFSWEKTARATLKVYEEVVT